MEDLACNWSPKLIVELIKSIAWPVVVLLFGFSFRSRLFGIVSSFFSKSQVSEISATTSGVSAKFVAAKQSIEVLETAGSNAANLPKDMGVEAIRERHEQIKTEFSEELYQAIIKHAFYLDISNEEKIELLSREISVFQSAIRYFDINKVLFRSQYELFNSIVGNNNFLSKEDAIKHFEITKKTNREALSDWDWIKYTAYPVSNHLLYEDDNGYKLTPLGRSYMAFMSKNPQLVDELAKL
ncbi:hypothetical protein D8682_24550 [Buttiauxella sp. 3AFRM03]|uniref:hypothetical protein n=1 Tax=Buttiauxella sp. 3AFRM03 TaxID=2479367 RepID=UPI000EF829C5|nr:hypothetical protein [Buttiauxella sp. 3AFRM03]AYN29864.1 hypothetical protein D8682_24550 [Buttiauxella sp. 3AFRM03]